MTAQREPHRLEELDSLRGVAAMVVVLFHVVKFWNPPPSAWWGAILTSPLSLLFDGPDAVLLFFLLSGFVLYLPYITSQSPSTYPRFVIKRVCRIYLPYLAALVLVLFADWYCYRPLGDALSHPIAWTRPFPTGAILPHIVFLGPSPIYAFNPAFWSLVHEMRISLVFPWIARLARRLPLAGGLVLGLTICGAGLMFLLSNHTEWATVGYAGLFLVGASMARHLEQIRGFAAKIGPFGRGFGFVLVVFLLKSMHGFPERLKIFPVQAMIHGAAAALIVSLALTTIHFKRLLHLPALRWLGRVSYSLYLTHQTVLYSVVCLFWNKTEHHVALVVAGVGLSLGFANLFHAWVERPTMGLGRWLGGKQQKRKETDPISANGAAHRAA